MTSARGNGRLTLALALAAAAIAAGAIASGASAETYTGPVKEIPATRIGWDVNATGKGGVCALASETCQLATPSSEPGGFTSGSAVAVNEDRGDLAHYGHVYVTDGGSGRVQELEAGGAFVSMFGWDVNRTKVEKGGASQQEMNVCTEAEVKAGGKCQLGAEGGAAPGYLGASGGKGGIAVDPVSGDVYVVNETKTASNRVQEFTAAGEWMLEIGREVNETEDDTPGATAQEKDLCTEEEVVKAGVKCTGPTAYEGDSTEPGVFSGASVDITAGGPEDLLYVANGERVQEFTAQGVYRGEIQLAGIATGGKGSRIAIDDSCQVHEPALSEATVPTCASFDPSYGDLYAQYEEATEATGSAVKKVHRFAPNGAALGELSVSPRAADGKEFLVGLLAVDPVGRLALSESEKTYNASLDTVRSAFGSLRDGESGQVISEFTEPLRVLEGTEEEGFEGIAFGPGDQLYGVGLHEVVRYTPVHVAELSTEPAACEPGGENGSSATLACTLKGRVDPEEVAGTEAWFQWGDEGALLQETARQDEAGGDSQIGVEAGVQGLRPNQTYGYRLAGFDANVQAPEAPLVSETASFTTPAVPPSVVGAPSVPVVGSSAVVMFAELNPENAATRYWFEYGPCAGAQACASSPYPDRSVVSDSALYGQIGTTVEVSGIQPATLYHYRLAAVNEHAETATGAEGTFTSAPAATPLAVTGAASMIGTTGAVVSGTVEADGEPGVFSFELGVYAGDETRYGIVSSGLVAASAGAVNESLQLTGLQSGTAYAYRIRISTPGYGVSYGEPVVFTTAGLPAVLVSPATLPMLAVPSIAFPQQPAAKASVKKLTRAQRLAQALRACAKQPKRKRASCERRARKQYGPVKSRAKR